MLTLFGIAADEARKSLCIKTLYSYINKDYIPGITQLDLPEREKQRKRVYNRVKIALNNTKGRSIEERPPEIAARTTFGHWEMYCIESGKRGSKAALLVLSERLTRYELIFKIKKGNSRRGEESDGCIGEKNGVKTV